MPDATITRQCWICFGEEGEGEGDMIRPCKCRGTSGWVHHSCLLDWIQVRSAQADASYASLQSSALLNPSCPQCATPYIIRVDYALPNSVLYSVISIRRWRDHLLLGSLALGTGALMYGAAWSMGFLTFTAVAGQRDSALFVKNHLQRCFNRWPSADSIIKSFVGIPLISLGSLAWNFPSLSWVFPLLPPILFANDSISSSDLLGPKMCTLYLPFGMFFYRLLWSKVYPELSKRWLAHYQIKDNLLSSSSSVSQIPSPAITITTDTNISNLEQESESIDERELRVSLLSITANLVFPFAASFLGYLIWGRRSQNSTPIQRAILGGSIILASHDLMHFLLWWQRVAIRPFRRILDYPVEEEVGKK